jgi:iron complex transport system permease protein
VIAAIGLAGAAVLAMCLLASFRVDFASDPELMLRANGARVLLGAAVGALLALGGGLRSGGRGRPLAELDQVAAATGAALGGFATVSAVHVSGPLQTAGVFALGAATGGFLGWGASRGLDRGSRWSNLGVALLLGAIVAGAAVAGSYVGARGDFVRPVVRWLLGDLAHASAAGAVALAAGAIAACGYAIVRTGRAGSGAAVLGWLASGAAIGAAGPLAFVGTFVPRTVAEWAPSASPRARLAASLVAGAAAVVAIDTVPRLLVGGYALPFNVAATMLAVPVFLGWNRARLRAHSGVGSRVLEGAELVGIGAATALAGAFAWFLTVVVRGAT